MPTVHVIAPFHNVPSARFSVDPFSGMALRLPKALHFVGYHTIEYANAGSESDADEHVALLLEHERACLFPDGLPWVGSPGWSIFDGRLREALRARLRPGDLIAHTFGASHALLVEAFPTHVHIETCVAYLDRPFGAYRIYASEAWRHYHWGLADGSSFKNRDSDNKGLSWVIPISFDVEDWPIGNGQGDACGPYALFLGRVIPSKGLDVLRALITAYDGPLRFKIVGPGSDELEVAWKKALSPAAFTRVDFVAPVTGKDRAALVGHATCSLMPTQNVEAFGASGVEGMLCGTPLIASDWGAFTETIVNGVTGFRCKTASGWLRALQNVHRLDRSAVAARARRRFSLEAVALLYDQAFRVIAETPVLTPC